MTVEKVTLFRSVDGKLHEKECDCVRSNFMLTAMPAIKSSILANAVSCDTALKLYSVEDICNWVLTCTPEIVSILSPLVIPVEPPRRRRTKADMALEKAAQAVLAAQNGSKVVDADPAQTLMAFAAKEADLLSVGVADTTEETDTETVNVGADEENENEQEANS